jgi:hypothetical protein
MLVPPYHVLAALAGWNPTSAIFLFNIHYYVYSLIVAQSLLCVNAYSALRCGKREVSLVVGLRRTVSTCEPHVEYGAKSQLNSCRWPPNPGRKHPRQNKPEDHGYREIARAAKKGMNWILLSWCWAPYWWWLSYGPGWRRDCDCGWRLVWCNVVKFTNLRGHPTISLIFLVRTTLTTTDGGSEFLLFKVALALIAPEKPPATIDASSHVATHGYLLVVGCLPFLDL